MKKKKTVWIPAIIAVTVAALLVIYYYYMSSVSGGGPGPRPLEGGVGNVSAGQMGRPPGGERHGGNGEIFKTLGTISVFVGAAAFSWFWFKKKLRSPSILVRKAGKLFHSMHKLLGWVTLILVAVHGGYFLITKLQDSKTYTGLACFAILLAIAGYGFFINKVRNKWMRTVHRSLGLLWVPVLLLHAGSSVILAVIASIAVGIPVWILEKMAGKTPKPVPGGR